MFNFFFFSISPLQSDENVCAEPGFSGLYSYHVPTNTWGKLRDDFPKPNCDDQEIKSRIGHSMLFHEVKTSLPFCISIIL